MFGYWIGGVDLVWLTGGWLGNEQLKVGGPCSLQVTIPLTSPERIEIASRAQVLTLLTALVHCICHGITCASVRERVLISREPVNPEDAHRRGGALNALGDIWSTLRTLPRPIQQVLNVQVGVYVQPCSQ